MMFVIMSSCSENQLWHKPLKRIVAILHKKYMYDYICVYVYVIIPKGLQTIN